MSAELYELPSGTLQDIPRMLRAIADEMEGGKYGKTIAAAIVIVRTFGGGAAPCISAAVAHPVQKACDDILAGIPSFQEPSGIRVRPQEKTGFFTANAEGPYSGVLADLMHKRGLLDNAISALQALSGVV